MGGFSQETLGQWGGAGRAGVCRWTNLSTNGSSSPQSVPSRSLSFQAVKKEQGRPAHDIAVRMKESDAYKVTAVGNIINTSTARTSTSPPPFGKVIYF